MAKKSTPQGRRLAEYSRKRAAKELEAENTQMLAKIFGRDGFEAYGIIQIIKNIDLFFSVATVEGLEGIRGSREKGY